MIHLQIDKADEPIVLRTIKDFTNNVNQALEDDLISDSTAIVFLDKSLRLKDLFAEYRDGKEMPYDEYRKYMDLSSEIRSFNAFFRKKEAGDSLEGGYIFSGGMIYYCLAEHEDYLLLIRQKDNIPVIAKGYNGIEWEHGTYGMAGVSKKDDLDQLSEMIDIFAEKSGLKKESRSHQR